LQYVARVQLLQALIGLFELPEDDELPAGEHFIEVDDTGIVYKYSVELEL